MAIDFPNTPADGDTYVNDNILYTYFAAKQCWKSTKILRVLTPTTETITVTLAAGQTITGSKVYSSGFLISAISTTHSAWVTLYSSKVSMDNDVSRSMSKDPIPGSNVLLEIISVGVKNYDVIPNIYGRITDATGRIYYKIKNLTTASATITVTLSMQKMGS